MKVKQSPSPSTGAHAGQRANNSLRNCDRVNVSFDNSRIDASFENSRTNASFDNSRIDASYDNDRNNEPSYHNDLTHDDAPTDASYDHGRASNAISFDNGVEAVSDIPSFDLGYVDFGDSSLPLSSKKPPIGAGAASFVRASFVSPGAGPRRSFRDSHRRRRSSLRGNNNNSNTRPPAENRHSSSVDVSGRKPRCFPKSSVLTNLKDTLLSCVSGGRTFEPVSPRPISSPISPSKPFSPRVGVYQLSQAHLAGGGAAHNAESGTELDSIGVEISLTRDQSIHDSHHIHGAGDGVHVNGIIDFDATMSSTHSASQPVDRSLQQQHPPHQPKASSDNLSHPPSPVIRPPSFKKPHPPSVLANSCIAKSGRDSVSSQGSESFQISSIDRKRALARSMWTKSERDSFRHKGVGGRAASDDLDGVKGRRLRATSATIEDSDDDAFKENPIRPRSLASSHHHSEVDAEGVLINSFRNSTRSKKSVKSFDPSASGDAGSGVGGGSSELRSEQSLLSHHPSLNSTAILLPPTPFINDSPFRGSSRSTRNDHLDASFQHEASPKSVLPPPKPSRSALSNRTASTRSAGDRSHDHSCIQHRPNESLSSKPKNASRQPLGRPVPGPQTSTYVRDCPSRSESITAHERSNNSSVFSRAKNNVSGGSGGGNSVSILKIKTTSNSETPSNPRESFRVRFQRSASTDHPRAPPRHRFGAGSGVSEESASRRRSRSADDYVLNGEQLTNQLRRENSKVRVLDLSNPEIVTYEMEESDFIAEFKNDFLEDSRRISRRSFVREEVSVQLKNIDITRVKQVAEPQHAIHQPQQRQIQQPQQLPLVHEQSHQPPTLQDLPQLQHLRRGPRESDDSIDLNLTVKDFLMRNGGKNEVDRKLLDGFFSYSQMHRDSTSGDDEEGEDSGGNESISEDSLEAPKTPKDEKSFFDNVEEIHHGGGGRGLTSSISEKKHDFSLKIPSYGNNLFHEGISSGKASQDPSPMEGLKSRAYLVNNEIGNNIHNVNSAEDDTSDYSQDSSEHDSDYARQLRDLQSRMKSAVLNNNCANNKYGNDGRQGENSSFDSAFDSLERPIKPGQRNAPPVSSSTGSAHQQHQHILSSSSSAAARGLQRRSLSSPSSSSFGFEATLVPQDLNGNLSTVEELSRASSVVSRVGGGGGVIDRDGIDDDASSSRLNDEVGSERRNVFSVTSSDSHYEFDADRSGGEGARREESHRLASASRTFDVESPDDCVVITPPEERSRPFSLSSASGFGRPTKQHKRRQHATTAISDGVKRDSFGNIAPGKVANLRAGFEGGRK